MERALLPYQHLELPLEVISFATNNFDDKNCIGVGGFGKVYKGELSTSKEHIMLAIKRLDPRQGQGAPEFLKEITTLSHYVHENLITLQGFCRKEHEMILVYEHASLGSLDRHLSSPHLMWSQRLNICLDAAKGINYLHDPKEAHQRLIHCDIKSANILLDEHWNAKVSDFGLSIMGPANEQHSVIVTLAAGTPGYCDPQFAMTHTLTKESDVYSFGVVLFEVLCGTLCCTYSNGRVQQKLVPMWIKSYEQNMLNDIIFKSPSIRPLDHTALETFSNIAYQCLKEYREDRPKMVEVVTELEIALEIQEFSEGKLLPFNYEEMAKTAEPPLSYHSEVELKHLLSKGVLLNGDKTWFSLNKKGEHCEMISCKECVVPGVHEGYPWSSGYNSRFVVGTYHSVNGKFKACVKSQFLSPQITYTVNLVFKFMLPRHEEVGKCHLISLKYKLQGEKNNSTSYLAYEKEDGWWRVELYQFTKYRRNLYLEIMFDGSDHSFEVIEVEGIEFRPLEKEDEKPDMQPISESCANWEENLPIDYEDIVKLSKNSMQLTLKDDLYSIFHRGFLINDGQEWFSLDRNGKKCYMLSATVAGIEGEKHRWRSLPKSRFGEVVEMNELNEWNELKALGRYSSNTYCRLKNWKHWMIKIDRKINYQLLSSQTYAAYLIYKLPRDQARYEALVVVTNEEFYTDYCEYVFLHSYQTPVIFRSKAYEDTHNTLNLPKIKGIPTQRDDGWMEVQIWKYQTDTTTDLIQMALKLTTYGFETLKGLIIEGVEFRPI